jgi:hypothetical protein
MKKGPLKKFFERAAAEATRMQNPVKVPLKQVLDIFEPGHRNYASAPGQHGLILINLNQGSPNRVDPSNPAARMYLTDPNYKITIRGAKSQFRDIPDEPDSQITGSAGIFYTEDYGMGKKRVAIVMRRQAKNLADYDDSLVFGLYGVVEKDGTLNIKKIKLPEVDHKFAAKGSQYIPVTDENVEKALKYASLCKTQLFERKPFTPVDNLDRADFHIGHPERKRNWLFPFGKSPPGGPADKPKGP